MTEIRKAGQTLAAAAPPRTVIDSKGRLCLTVGAYEVRIGADEISTLKHAAGALENAVDRAVTLARLANPPPA